MKYRRAKIFAFSAICGCLLPGRPHVGSSAWFVGELQARSEARHSLAQIAGQKQSPPNGVPIIRLDKSRFVLGKSVFFWVGVESTSRAPILKERMSRS